MKSHIHSQNSVNKYGGKKEDYNDIHNFLDSTKAHYADVRHRAILHNSWGIFICEKIFGETIKNSDGKLVAVRSIAEDHIMEDLGFIPTIKDYLEGMLHYKWLWGGRLTDDEIKEIQEKAEKSPIEEIVEIMKRIERKSNHPTIPTEVPGIPFWDKNQVVD